ncbi:hypothetical protein DPMN_021869 [Dreissena polymorpha]|uniref:Uncharacterized protein n=1 Tax=Dreissena polymorpha TaxID=45954 RepID=A0A9D4SAC1_DREPO|nr:hypothetical protein DPMN_021869 [Dreissena polymorpha]
MKYPMSGMSCIVITLCLASDWSAGETCSVKPDTETVELTVVGKLEVIMVEIDIYLAAEMEFKPNTGPACSSDCFWNTKPNPLPSTDQPPSRITSRKVLSGIVIASSSYAVSRPL